MNSAIAHLSTSVASVPARVPALGLLLVAFAMSSVAYEAALAQQSRPGVTPAQQQQPAAGRAARGGGSATSPFAGMGGDSKEPIKIDADKLDVLDKENRAVFSGNVVAVQGETTVRCSKMTVFYEGRGQAGLPGAAAPAPAAPAQAASAPGSNDSSIKRIECAGPVTVVSKTQAATSDNAVFDRAANKVIMTGNVALNDGPNITRGQRLVYDTQTGVANVEGGRVQGFFVPNSTEASSNSAKPQAGAPARSGAPTN